MRTSLKFFLFSFLFLADVTYAEDSLYMGNPIALRSEAHNAVLGIFPNAELWLIQNYIRKQWDDGCSRFGWIYLFVGHENGLEKDIRVKFDHAKQLDGTCKYTARKDLEIEPSQIIGVQRLHLDVVQVGYDEALENAKKAVSLPFKLWWVKLITPLHPASNGRVFWNFKGPVICNKDAELTIDAATGALEKIFSTIPTCQY